MSLFHRCERCFAPFMAIADGQTTCDDCYEVPRWLVESPLPCKPVDLSDYRPVEHGALIIDHEKCNRDTDKAINELLKKHGIIIAQLPSYDAILRRGLWFWEA